GAAGPQGLAVPGDAPSAMPRAWTRRRVTQQGPQFARTEGLFFRVPHCVSVGLPSRGAILQLTASPLIAATITYQSWQLHLVEPFRFSTFPHRVVCWMRVNGSVPQADAGQLVSRRQPSQSGYVGKQFRLAFVEVTRQRLNS